MKNIKTDLFFTFYKNIYQPDSVTMDQGKTTDGRSCFHFELEFDTLPDREPSLAIVMPELNPEFTSRYGDNASTFFTGSCSEEKRDYYTNSCATGTATGKLHVTTFAGVRFDELDSMLPREKLDVNLKYEESDFWDDERGLGTREHTTCVVWEIEYHPDMNDSGNDLTQPIRDWIRTTFESMSHVVHPLTVDVEFTEPDELYLSQVVAVPASENPHGNESIALPDAVNPMATSGNGIISRSSSSDDDIND